MSGGGRGTAAGELRAKLDAARRKNKRKRGEETASASVSMGAELAAKTEMTSAAAWVKRSRKTAATSVSQARSQEEGSSGASSEVTYTSKDLEGMVIGHDISSFKEGESVILTLADADVLDESGELELTNANLADDDRLRLRKERERKLKKPLYSAYIDEEDEGDEFAGSGANIMVRRPRMLAQYDQEDDEKSARERRRVAIGSGGTVNPSELEEAKMIAERLQAAQQGKTLTSLNSGVLKVGRDYMTKEEVDDAVAAAASFKKSKKRKKKKKKSRRRERSEKAGVAAETSDQELEGDRQDVDNSSQTSSAKSASLADELEARALASGGVSSSSRGRRGKTPLHSSLDPDLAQELQEHERQVRAFNAAMKKSWDAQKRSTMGAAGDGHGPGGGGKKAVTSEEELAAAMRIAREQDEEREAKRKADRLALATGVGGVNPDEGKLVFSSTVQFTDQLKSRILQMADEQAAAEARASRRTKPSSHDEKLESGKTVEAAARDELHADAVPEARETSLPSSSSSSTPGPAPLAAASSSSAPEPSNSMPSATPQDDKPSSDAKIADPFARREPLASSGLAASLALLRRGNNLSAKSSGRDLAFSRTGAKSVKTEGADGGLKYEHRDSQGNLLSTKEAWRLQNYVFHGQNPGRKKMQKRQAQLEAMQPKSQLTAQAKQTRALRARLKHSKQAHVKLNY